MSNSRFTRLWPALSALALCTVAGTSHAATNLALGKTTATSSTENASLTAPAAVDGNTGTRWSSAFTDPSWISVDLGSTQTINRVVLKWEAAYAKAYQIQVSSDNSTWTTVYTQTAGTGGTEDLSFAATAARYVRMLGTVRATPYGYSLYEFEVYGVQQYVLTATAGANGTVSPASATVNAGASQSFAIKPATGYVVDAVTVDGASVGAVTSYNFTNVQAAHTLQATFKAQGSGTDLAQGKVVTASSTENANTPASAAVDGSLTTRWSSAFVDPSWITVDLGSSQAIGRVVLRWEAAYGKAYQIQVSNDGSNWTSVYTQSAGTGGNEDISFNTVSARYVRMNGTARGTAWGYSLWAFEVYPGAVKPTYAITASAGSNGTITPSGTATITQGANQTYTIAPASGYVVDTVTVDGVNQGAIATYTFSNVQAAHTINATFRANDGLLWADEFDAPTIDSTKWAFDLGTGPNGDGWGNGEWEYYTNAPENAAIENGNLVITLKNDSVGGKPFSSSRLVTRGLYSFRHGRIVARIKMPQGSMVWPCLWLLGDHSEGWPKCGELDIAEMFCGATGVGDNAVFSTSHWFHDLPSPGGYANFGETYTHTAPLSADFHEYEFDWDDTQVVAKFDGKQYHSMSITDPSLSELKDNFYYFILNLAAGKPQYGMTSADQIGPLPQKMYIDWIRVYQNGSAEVLDKKASQPTGTLGVFADGTPTDSAVKLGVDGNLFLWNNLTAVTATPAAGATSIAVKTNDTSWFGLGIATATRRNLLNYAAGTLNLRMKTNSTDTFQIGVAGGNNGNAWVTFTNGSDPYGFARDNQWHTVSIPMTKFGGADFTDITQYFMMVSKDAVTAGKTFEFDEITWSPNAPENVAKPTGTTFGVYTDRTCDAGKFNLDTDGAVFVWNTANHQVMTSTPFEGSTSYGFSAPQAQWFGLGFTPTKLYNLSAFAKGHLHLALKVPASTTGDFKIGIKSPGGTNVRESWIQFQAGSDPYGFVRDGRYHELLIPASAFNNCDLSAIAQLLMITGDGTAQMEIDDVYWTAN